jgi:hypothetical protein
MSRRLPYYLFWLLAAAMGVMAIPAMAKQITLGPPDPGAEHGFDYWYHGASGKGFLSVDDTDSATGNNDFTLGNNTPGQENRADWRSQNFTLGSAVDDGSPITFSFVYKLPGEINGNENLRVYLRFFDATGTNFLSAKTIRIGSSTGDSNMMSYKNVTLTNIHTPRGVKTADIWITANIFEPWTSGTARFDDFSVTTVPPHRSMKISIKILLGLGIALAASVMWICHARRKRVGA